MKKSFVFIILIVLVLINIYFVINNNQYSLMESPFSERAQRSIKESYISLDKKYSFNLPTIGVTLNIPARAGFNVDMDDEIKNYTDIETRDVYYFFDTDALKNRVVETRFSLPQSDDPALFMGIMLLAGDVNETSIIKQYKESDAYMWELPGFQCGLGKLTGFRLIHNQAQVNIYFLKHKQYFFFFQYAIEDEDFCLDIIKTVKDKKFNSKIHAEYQEHLEYLKERDGEEEEELVDLNEFTGKTQQPTLFSVPGLGTGINVPEGYTYTCRANEIKHTNTPNSAIKELSLTKSDIKRHMASYLNFNNNKGLFIMFGFWDELNPNERISADIKAQEKLKRFQLIIDGVEFDAIALGHEESPTINAYAKLNDFGMSIMLMNIDKGKLTEVERLIEGIKFSDEQKEGIKTQQKGKLLSQLISIKEKKAQTLPELNFTKSGAGENQLVSYSFTGLGVKCLLPKGIEYANPEECLETITKTEKKIIGDLDKDQFLSVSTSSNDYTKSTAVSIVKNITGGDLDSLMDTMVKSWAAYKHIKIKQKGIGTANGKRWGLIVNKQGDSYLTMFFTLHNELSITFTVNSPNENIQEYIDLLFDFTFE